MSELTELESLKQIAENKGISFGPNIGVSTLKRKIEDFDAKMDIAASKREQKSKTRHEAQKEALKLVRVVVNSNDPAKKELQGEWMSVGNSLLGTHTKYVLFGHEYHLTEFMVKQLELKQYRTSRSFKDRDGVRRRKNYFHRAYNIERLPALTEKELAELRTQQSKRSDSDD